MGHFNQLICVLIENDLYFLSDLELMRMDAKRRSTWLQMNEDGGVTCYCFWPVLDVLLDKSGQNELQNQRRYDTTTGPKVTWSGYWDAYDGNTTAACCRDAWNHTVDYINTLYQVPSNRFILWPSQQWLSTCYDCDPESLYPDQTPSDRFQTVTQTFRETPGHCNAIIRARVVRGRPRERGVYRPGSIVGWYSQKSGKKHDISGPVFLIHYILLVYLFYHCFDV